MSIQVLCIGSELLVGETLNTNLLYVGAQLGQAGLAVDKETAIPDEPAIMVRAFREALGESDVVISIGGLGPTKDDRTKDAAAEALGVSLVFHEPTAERIGGLYRERGIKAKEGVVHRQAMLPEGADVIPNEWGTAPTLHCRTTNSQLFMLPGPPREFEPMFAKHVLPRILDRLPPASRRVTFAVFGNPESTIEQRTEKALHDFPEIEPAYCVKTGRAKCDVRLTTAAANADRLELAAAAVRDEFGHDLADKDSELADLVADLLRRRGWRLAVAESCTAGAIGKLITDRAGASDFFVGGAITYSNELKVKLLGVREETIAAHGAVSAETAGEMAAGLAERYGVEAAIAVTGIAGPTGGTPDKPVGTVYLATWVNGDLEATRHHYRYDRASVRDRAAIGALNQLRAHLLRLPPPD